MLINMAWRKILTDKKYNELTDNSLKSYDAVWYTLGKWFTENQIERIDQLSTFVFKNHIRYCTYGTHG